jgi:signal peptidase I
MTKPVNINVPNECACNLVGEVVGKAGRVRLRVAGTSMAPAMRPGDLITVESADLRGITLGEIVVFIREGRLVAHRVIAIFTAPAQLIVGDTHEPLSQTRLMTRGDRARHDDPAVSSSELLGRVTQIERGSQRMRLRNKLTTADHVICRLLRLSDRATGLYLRVSAL